jgi:hypothetical protein
MSFAYVGNCERCCAEPRFRGNASRKKRADPRDVPAERLARG